MPSGNWPRPPIWSGEGDWSVGGPGAWAWHGFGRRMFFAMALFFGGGLATVALIGATVGTLLGSRVIAVIATPIIVAILVFAGGAWLWRTWRPVRALISSAARLAEGDYTARVDATATPAMGSVVRSFNEMATRLEEADEQRRRLIMDLSHELRTPLTVVRGEIEALLDGVHEPTTAELTQLIGEVAVIERLIEDLQTLSQSAAGALTLRRETFDLGDLALEVVELQTRLNPEAGVALSVDDTQDAHDLWADPVRMREVLTNLVVNAVRACSPGDRVDIHIETTADAAAVVVADTGSGIPADEIPLVFERFHKGSNSSGSGLGLTICRELIEAHGGIIVLDSEEGVGTAVRFQLPNRSS